MDSPELTKYFAQYWTGSEDWSVLAQAKAELAYETFRAKVEAKKQELLTYVPWYVKLFPYKITIERKI
jgi:hypothetical protein